MFLTRLNLILMTLGVFEGHVPTGFSFRTRSTQCAVLVWAEVTFIVAFSSRSSPPVFFAFLRYFWFSYELAGINIAIFIFFSFSGNLIREHISPCFRQLVYFYFFIAFFLCCFLWFNNPFSLDLFYSHLFDFFNFFISSPSLLIESPFFYLTFFPLHSSFVCFRTPSVFDITFWSS